MDWSGLLSQALGITSTFNPKIAILLFLLCVVGEIGFALPYILETIWLLAGYQLARGALSPVDILLIWLIAQAGRQTGSLVLYFSGVYGLPPLRRFFKRFIEPRMPKRQIIPSNLARSLADPSPFSIASARLVGLRIPIALLMSARQRLFPLVLGVLISSIVWDGAYLIVGSLVGATVATQPVNMLLYSLGGLTVLYLIVLSIRYLIRSRVHRKENQP
jgi:hypothetical protein